MPRVTTRMAVILAIVVLLAGAIMGGFVNSTPKQPLDSAVHSAGYESVGSVSQNSVGHGVSQYLQAQAGTCLVLIYRRATDQGHWYTTYYKEEQLSSSDTLPSAKETIQAITRLASNAACMP